MHSVTVQLFPSKEAFYPYCLNSSSSSRENACANSSWSGFQSAVPGLHLQPLLTVGCIPSLTACGFPGGQFIPHGPLPSKLTPSQPASVDSSESPGHKKAASLSMKQFQPLKCRLPVPPACFPLQLWINHLQHVVYVVKARHHTMHYKIDIPPC